MMIRLQSAGVVVRDHPVKLLSADAALLCSGRRARRGARELPVSEAICWACRVISSDNVITVGLSVFTSLCIGVTTFSVTRGSDVMQAMDQTNPANSRATA